MTHILLVFLLSILGSTIQSVVGFGYVMLAMAVWPLFLPAGDCVLLAQIGGVLMTLFLLMGHVKEVNWRKIALPTLLSSAASLGSLFFLRSLDTSAYMKALGVVLLLLALWMMKFSAKVKIRPTPLNGILAGALAGLMGALFAVAAPPLILYYSANSESKDDYTMGLQMTLFLQSLVCLFGRAALDLWSPSVWPLIPAIIAGIFLGKIPGKWFYGKLDLKTFKLLVYLAIGILGLYIFLSN
jgi:uncharacterized membrane protein YfcA